MKQRWDHATGKFVDIEDTKTKPNEMANKFKLVIPRHVMDKISWWMHKSDQEVSGFGSLEFDEKTNTFKVKDAILLKQKVTGTSAEIDPSAIGRAMFLMKDEPMGMKWHWHSHVNMGVFWSGDDMELIRQMGQHGWILASVFNYKEERRTAYMTSVNIQNPAGGEPLKHDVFVDDIDTKVINFVPEEQYKVWDKEFEDNVSEEKKVVVYGGGEVTTFHSGKTFSWNNFGYAEVSDFVGGSLYNPCFDSSLKTIPQRIKAIKEMQDDEIEYLIKNSPSFKTLHDQMLRKTKMDHMDEAEWDEMDGWGFRI